MGDNQPGYYMKGGALEVGKAALVLGKKGILSCEHMVSFLGFKQNPFNYFANAQFFILASEFEGFPMVLIESLACFEVKDVHMTGIFLAAL